VKLEGFNPATVLVLEQVKVVRRVVEEASSLSLTKTIYCAAINQWSLLKRSTCIDSIDTLPVSKRRWKDCLKVTNDFYIFQ
jgi:hypothetical protein